MFFCIISEFKSGIKRSLLPIQDSQSNHTAAALLSSYYVKFPRMLSELGTGEGM